MAAAKAKQKQHIETASEKFRRLTEQQAEYGFNPFLAETGTPIISTNGPFSDLDPFPKGGENISPHIEGIWKKRRKEKKK